MSFHRPLFRITFLRLSGDSKNSLKKTVLWDLHKEYGASFGEFAGYSMPLWYSDGQIAEHLHCRNSAALFDVSHMLQITMSGPDLFKFLDKITITDWLSSVTLNRAKLSCILRETGGMVDDLIITPLSTEELKGTNTCYTVVNAGAAAKDMEYFQTQRDKLGMQVQFEPLTTRSLLALQGPRAAEVLSRLLDPPIPTWGDLQYWPFMVGHPTTIAGIPVHVTRCGYTGEDGFEISVQNEDAERLARMLLASPAVRLAGLGARDTLRLEAGLNLSGTDTSEDTTPIEAGMRFLLTKKKLARTDWYGAERIIKEYNEGPGRVRVGVAFPDSKRAVRGGTPLLDPDTGAPVGVVTSGARSPCLGYPIGLGFLPPRLANEGTEVVVRWL